MIESFVRRPATTIIFVSVFMVLGFVSFFNLNVERSPSIEFPLITVKTTYPGATPEEVEIQVIKKIEEAVSEISEIKSIKSYAYESFGYTIIEFLLSADANTKSIEVKDKVDAIVNDLPDAAEDPIVEKFDPLATPVMELVLSSDSVDLKDLYEYADKKLKNILASISGIAKIEIYGGKIRQINVRLDPLLMKKNFLSITDVVQTMSYKNINVPGGTIDRSESSFNVRFLGEFSSLDEIRNMKLTSAEGNEVTLGDIAVVEDGFRRIEDIARFNGKEVVGLSVIKVSDGNAVKISNALRKRLPNIRNLLPKGSKLEIAKDESLNTNAETVDTGKNIILGILLTIIILYVFTGRFAITFIASIVIPTSLISSFFLMDKAGFTVNMMSLLAIATSLGTLIANAIVIIESALVHMDKGKDSVNAAIDGTKEVTIAVLASVGTNLVVFTPLAFMGGIVGRFMMQFGMTVVFATIFSLVASFSLTPMLFALIMKRKTSKKEENLVVRTVNKSLNFLIREYRHIFNFIFRFPKLTMILSFLALFGSFMIVPFLGNEFSSPSDADLIDFTIKMPQGVKIERTTEVVKKVEEIIKDIPEGKSYLSSIGEDGVENAKVTLNLYPYKERNRNDLAIIEELIPQMAQIPDAEIHMTRGKMASGDIGDLAIEVYGVDYDEMIRNSYQMLDLMEKSGYFRSVTMSYRKPKDEVRFLPDQEKMKDYGIPNVLLAQTLRASIYGDESNIYKEDGEEYDINIAINEKFKRSEDDISKIHVISRKGLLPITMLGETKVKKALPLIRRRDKDRIIYVEGILAKSTMGVVSRILDSKYFSQINFKEGHGYRYAGSSEHQSESQSELGKAFFLATILTYMILVAILNSFLYPIPILTTVLTSFSGVFVFLLFGNFSINIGSMMALIMLVGLVVNNAILVLEVAIRKINEGVEIIDALWIGLKDKFRVILMTTIAIIFGTLPQLGSVMAAKASIGAVIMGGLLFSIPYTLVLVPVLFWYIERLRRRFIKG